MKHGDQVVFQIDHAADPAGKVIRDMYSIPANFFKILPATDLIFNDLSSIKNKVSNQMTSLKLLQNVNSLPPVMRPKPSGQLLDSTNPFTRIDCITDPVDTPIGGAKVCIAAKNRKIKETGVPACANAPVTN